MKSIFEYNFPDFYKYAKELTTSVTNRVQYSGSHNLIQKRALRALYYIDLGSLLNKALQPPSFEEGYA